RYFRAPGYFSTSVDAREIAFDYRASQIRRRLYGHRKAVALSCLSRSYCVVQSGDYLIAFGVSRIRTIRELRILSVEVELRDIGCLCVIAVDNYRLDEILSVDSSSNSELPTIVKGVEGYAVIVSTVTGR